MPELICPGGSGHVEYTKGEGRVRSPSCGQWRETGEPKPPYQVTDICFILIDVAAAVVTAFIAIKLFGPFEWK